MRRLLVRLRALVSGRRRAAEIDDEIAFHLAEEAEARRAAGLPADEAAFAARRDFGNVTAVRETTREAWVWGAGERLLQDLRYGARAVASAPLVSIVAVLTLTLAIGANTAIFSIVSGLLLRPLPVDAPERLALLSDTIGRRLSWTNPIWEHLRDHGTGFDGAFAWSTTRLNLAPSGETDFADGLLASGRMFEILGVQAALGRVLDPRDDRRNLGPDGPVAVISHAFWQRRFAGSPAVIGRTITLDRVPFTIVGVAPPGFFGVEVGRTFDVAIPIAARTLIDGPGTLDRRASWWLRIMFRLKPGQSLDAANAELQRLTPGVKDATRPQEWAPARFLREGLAVSAAPQGASGLRRAYEKPLTVIMGVALLVLLIACANLANLLLARAAARQPELSLRLALGASRRRIARQLLIESALLAVAGAAGGLVVARLASRAIVDALSTATNSVHLDVGLDWRSLAFTVLAGAITTLLFGVAPAWRGMRAEPADALKAAGRGATRAQGAFGQGLVVAQVALSLMLLVGAGLLVRTFTTLAHRDLGFESSPVLVARVVAGAGSDETARVAWADRLGEAAAAVPGVRSVGLSAIVPISGASWNNRVDLVGRPPLPEDASLTWFNMVTPGWFATYGTRVIAGRDFGAGDTAGAPQVAIVNETFARLFAGGRNPIGLEIREPGRDGTPVVRRIVGYVEDAAYDSLRDPTPPTLYMPYAQGGGGSEEAAMSIRVAGGSPALIARPLAAALAQVDAGASLTLRQLADQVDDALTQERVVATLAGAFGGLGVVLACIGLYGVTAYAVSRRRTEIAVRLALGASPARVVTRVLARVAMTIAIGAAIGIGLSLWTAPLLETLLYGLAPRDTATIAAATAMLAAVGGLAGWIPARRAARVDPARVLRDG
jgi:putative ABC transport system permease protein